MNANKRIHDAKFATWVSLIQKQAERGLPVKQEPTTSEYMIILNFFLQNCQSTQMTKIILLFKIFCLGLTMSNKNVKFHQKPILIFQCPESMKSLEIAVSFIYGTHD